jgi:hypothetical protein
VTDELEFTVGDLGVIRLESSQDERFAKVVLTYTDGSARFQLSDGGHVRIWPNRYSSMKSFFLIKHTPAAEVQYHSKHHVPNESSRQAEIKAWLATRPPRGESQ